MRARSLASEGPPGPAAAWVKDPPSAPRCSQAGCLASVSAFCVQGRPGGWKESRAAVLGLIRGPRLLPDSRPITDMGREWATPWLASGDLHPLPGPASRAV